MPVGAEWAGAMVVGPSEATTAVSVIGEEDAVAAMAASLTCFGNEQENPRRDTRAGSTGSELGLGCALS
jgi:hypothetical protein